MFVISPVLYTYLCVGNYVKMDMPDMSYSFKGVICVESAIKP